MKTPLAAYPALEGFAGASRVAGIVLVATAASLLVQGGTLPFVATRAADGEGELRQRAGRAAGTSPQASHGDPAHG